MSQYYSITIKNNKKDYITSELELTKVLMHVINRHKGEFYQSVYELDSENRLHLHGSFKARKNILVHLAKVPFYHIYIKAIPSEEDLNRWIHYCLKDYRIEMKECIEHYAAGGYHFI